MFDSLWRCCHGLTNYILSMNRFSGIASHLKNTSDRRIWGACEGNQRRADKAFLQAWRLEKLNRSCGTGKQTKNQLGFEKTKGHGISFTGPATLYNSSIRGLLKSFLWTWHGPAKSFYHAQKRCDMRIIGFDKESRPVLYFCVYSSVEWRTGLSPSSHMPFLLLKLLNRLWARKIGCRLGPRTSKNHKVVDVIVSQMCWVREVSRSLWNPRVFDARVNLDWFEVKILCKGRTSRWCGSMRSVQVYHGSVPCNFWGCAKESVKQLLWKRHWSHLTQTESMLYEHMLSQM